MQEFPQAIIDKLQHYVYLYIDPRNDEIFYVGKGQSNRCFVHLDAAEQNQNIELHKRIKSIRQEGNEPRIEILIHGIAKAAEAKKIEASAIDLIGIEKLANKYHGYGKHSFGRMGLEQIKSLYEEEEIKEITEKVLFIKLNINFRYGMKPMALYDASRYAWVVGEERREQVEYAIILYESVVQEVYKVEGWFPKGSTYNTFHDIDEDEDKSERWEFVGNIAEPKIRNKYLFKYLPPEKFQSKSSNPITYWNID